MVSLIALLMIKHRGSVTPSKGPTFVVHLSTGQPRAFDPESYKLNLEAFGNRSAVPVEPKENPSQPENLNFREKPRKTAVFLCLAGILAGGVIGELLRESMVTASQRHMVFAALLNTPEVQAALAAKRDESPAANEMIPVHGNWARDVFWEDGHVAYFVLADGSFYFDTPRPSKWLFPMVLLCPVLGFLIPWGLMKALSKMGVEYFAKKAAPPAPP